MYWILRTYPCLLYDNIPPSIHDRDQQSCISELQRASINIAQTIKNEFSSKKRLLTIKYAFIAILFYILHAHQSLPEKSEVSLFIRKTSCCLFFFNLQFVFCKQEAQSNQFQSGFSALDLNPFMTFAKHVSKFQGEGEEDSWHCNFLWWTNWCITKRHPHTQATRQLTTKSDLNTGLEIAIKKR